MRKSRDALEDLAKALGYGMPALVNLHPPPGYCGWYTRTKSVIDRERAHSMAKVEVWYEKERACQMAKVEAWYQEELRNIAAAEAAGQTNAEGRATAHGRAPTLPRALVNGKRKRVEEDSSANGSVAVSKTKATKIMAKK